MSTESVAPTSPAPAPTLFHTLNMVSAIKTAASMKSSRNFESFFADRLIQSFAEPTLLDAIERLSRVVDASVEFIGAHRMASFMRVVNNPDAPAVLAWIRGHSRVVAMLCSLKSNDDYIEAINSIDVGSASSDDSVITHQPEYGIPLTVTCLSPLAHGGDNKAGNATLFRRKSVITETGKVMSLPFYAGNAVRGQLRDVLGDHLAQSLGLTSRRDEPAFELWFFHALYSGGILEEKGANTMEKINAQLGKNGSIRTDGMRLFREMLPGLSLLGAALGNRIITGRIAVGDLRPRCKEWGTGDVTSHRLLDHLFLTRREDYEGRAKEDGTSAMIATTEVLTPGTVLDGGIDIDTHAGDLEISALGVGLRRLAEYGYLGAENRRGFGNVRIDVGNLPDPEPYETFLRERKEEIMEYLQAIGALHVRA